MNGIETEVLHKMRSAVKAKLHELKSGGFSREVPEYILILLVNKKNQTQLETALKRFLGKNTKTFVVWLLDVISKLQDVTIPLENRKKDGVGAAGELASITDLIREGLIHKVKTDLELAAAVKTEVITIEEGDDDENAGDEERERAKKQLEELQKKIDKAKKKLLDDAEKPKNVNKSPPKPKEQKTPKESRKSKDLQTLKNSSRSKEKDSHNHKNHKKVPAEPEEKRKDKNHRSSPRRRRSKTPPLTITRRIIEKYDHKRKRKTRTPPPSTRKDRNDSRKNGERPPRFRPLRHHSPVRPPNRRKERNGRKKLESIVVSATTPSHTPPLDPPHPAPSPPPAPTRSKDKLLIEVKNDFVDTLTLDEEIDIAELLKETPKDSSIEPQFIVTISGHPNHKRRAPDPPAAPAVAAKSRRFSPIRFDLDEKSKPSPPPTKKKIIRLESTHKFDNLPSLDVATSGTATTGLKHKERCKFFPNCRDAKFCEFHHPSAPCIAFPACPFGDKCLYLHPTCKFDGNCSKVGCNFLHSMGNVTTMTKLVKIVPKIAQQAPIVPLGLCKFHPNCTNPVCNFHHPPLVQKRTTMMMKKKCKFGSFCLNKRDCGFYHGSDVPPKEKLKWVNR